MYKEVQLYRVAVKDNTLWMFSGAWKDGFGRHTECEEKLILCFSIVFVTQAEVFLISTQKIFVLATHDKSIQDYDLDWLIK